MALRFFGAFSKFAWYYRFTILALIHDIIHVFSRVGRVLDSRQMRYGFEPHRRHCVVAWSKNINPSLILVQPRKIRSFINESLLMGRKESNQTNKIKCIF